MQTSVLLDGVSLAARFGFAVQEVIGAGDSPGRDLVTAPVPGTLSSLVLGDGPPQKRTLQVVGNFLHDTAAARESAQDELKSLAHAGLLRFVQIGGGQSTRTAEVLLDGRAPIRPYAPARKSRGAQWSIPLTVPKGIVELLEPRILHVTAVNTPVSILGLGTYPSTPIIRLLGEAGPIAPELVYRDAWGRERQRFTSKSGASGFNMGADDWADVDCRFGTVTVYRSGVAENGIDYFTTASDFPIVFDPADGDPAASLFPTIETITGKATAMYWTAL